MDLDEYIWRTRRTTKDLSDKIGCSANALCILRKRKSTPGLFLALKLVYQSEGQIDFAQLLSDADVKRFQKWIDDKSAKEI